MNQVDPKALQLHSFGRSEIGPVRRDNQDSGFFSSKSAFIADGVGGCSAGDVASSTICSLMAEYTNALEKINMRTLSAALTKANRELSEIAFKNPDYRGMATTFSGLFYNGTALFAVHIGDSRIYRLRGERLEQITRDDTWVQMLIEQGMLTEEEIATHPMRNMLLHSISGAPQDASLAAIAPISCKVGDRWLIATDGLSSYLTYSEILNAVRAKNAPQDCVDELMDKALSKTRDNVTVIVADVEDNIDSPQNGTLIGSAANQVTWPAWEIRA